jgi:predicted PurR-regulated permease PerM
MPPRPTIKGKSETKGAGPLPSSPQARIVSRVALTIAIALLALWVAAEFLAPLAWAGIIAIATWPMYTRFAALFPNQRWPAIAPLLFTLLIGAILFLPIALATHQIAQQSEAIINGITQAGESGIPLPGWIAQLPIAAESVQQWWRDNLSEPRAAAGWFQRFNADTVVAWLKALGGQLLHRAFLFFISLIALFALLRHGAWIANRALDTADHIFGDPGERLASRLIEAVRGSVNGTVLVAVAEGLLIGMAYAVLGVPNWAMFTLLTVAFAMLPLGAWVAFTAAALTLVFNGGSTWAAVAVFGWGAVIMLAGDHFVWPTLVGGAARLPFLLALIGIFGGLQALGLVGLFLGPVVMAALVTIWREWLVGSQKTEADR